MSTLSANIMYSWTFCKRPTYIPNQAVRPQGLIWTCHGYVIWGSQWGCSKHGTRLIFWMFHATRLTPLRPSTNNTVIWTKIIHDTRLIFSLFHDTRLIFWMFHATRLTPLRPSHMLRVSHCNVQCNYVAMYKVTVSAKFCVICDI